MVSRKVTDRWDGRIVDLDPVVLVLDGLRRRVAPESGVAKAPR